jgi:dipeptidyl aminopeptidase/acylaminoacyl peptidase
MLLMVLQCTAPFVVCQAIRRPAITFSREKRAITVLDTIRMTRLADPYYTAGQPTSGNVAQFSPDGKQFVVILKKGNVERNTIDYSVLRWRISQSLRFTTPPAPEVVLTLSSSSNRPAIQGITWLGDNETIAFLGERLGQSQQLYAFNLRTRELRQLVAYPTNLVAYSMSATSHTIVFGAETPVKSLTTKRSQVDGILVFRQALADLIAGKTGGASFGHHELLIQRPGSKSLIHVKTEDEVSLTYDRLSLSPDGRYFVVPSEVVDIPESWTQYRDNILQGFIRQRLPRGVPSNVRRYILVDTRTGASQILLNAPAGMEGSEVAWSPDSKSLVLGGTYLPLDVGTPWARNERKTKTFAIEIKIPSREVATIADGNLKLLRWDVKTGSVLFANRRAAEGRQGLVAFHRDGPKWKEVSSDRLLTGSGRRDVVLDEDLNAWPKLVVVDPDTHRKSMLLDLNPQFEGLEFGKVQEVEWRSTDGRMMKGGLYWPTHYVPGRRYPLVIQTHGFTATKFWIDGPWPTGFVAQPLCSKGFVVLQVDEGFDDEMTPQEPRHAMATYEGAIDYLDSRGLIDRTRVGIIGFSRSCLYVKYTLAHSKYRFAAAAIADGIDAGYFQYLAFGNAFPEFAAEVEGLNGAAPFGDGLQSWLKVASGFSLGQVETPLRIEALNSESILGEWEWFSGLSRLHKPVEMVFIPNAGHIIERPSDRLISQQGNVDWFAFWLKGEKDMSSAKRDQYARWLALCELTNCAAKTKP